MPLKLAYLCDLLDELETVENLHVPLTKRDKSIRYTDLVTRWFGRHRKALDASDTQLAALLSCLLPERRSDRVYGMQHDRLTRAIAGALGLGATGFSDCKPSQMEGNSLRSSLTWLKSEPEAWLRHCSWSRLILP